MTDDSGVDSAAPVDTPSSIHDLRPKMQLDGCVTKIDLYGAFVDIGIKQDGLVHISQLDRKRVDKVSDVLKEGDEVLVKVLDVDENGKIRLSRKAALGESLDDV